MNDPLILGESRTAEVIILGNYVNNLRGRPAVVFLRFVLCTVHMSGEGDLL